MQLIKRFKDFFDKANPKIARHREVSDFLEKISNPKYDWTVAFPISNPKTKRNWKLEELRHYPKSIKGEEILRSAIVDYFHRQQIECSSNNIIIDDSVFSILGEIYKILGLNKKGKILLTTPIFGYYYQHCLHNEVDVELLETKIEDNWQIDPQKLAKKLNEDRDIKILLFNYPNNPLGKVMTKDYAKSIAKVLASYPDLIIVSDEILQDMILDQKLYSFSIASLAELKNRVITLNGVSKSRGLAGIRVSFASAPLAIAKKYPYNLRHPIGMPTINQIIAAQSLLDNKENRNYLEDNISQYLNNIKNIKKQITLLNNKLNQHFQTSKQIYIKPFIANPESGNIFLIDFSALRKISFKNNLKINSGLDLAKFLLDKASLAATPSEYYFLDEKFLVLRLCTSTPKKELKEGFGKITEALLDNLITQNHISKSNDSRLF